MSDYNRVKTYLKNSKENLGFIAKDDLYEVVEVIRKTSTKVSNKYIDRLELAAEQERTDDDPLTKIKFTREELNEFYINFRISVATSLLNASEFSNSYESKENIRELQAIMKFCSILLSAIEKQDVLVFEEQEHVEDSEDD